MPYSMEREDVSTQRALVQRKQASSGPEMSKAIGEALGAAFTHAQASGTPIAGRPFARYLETGPGPMTFEAGVFVSPPDESSDGQREDGVMLVTIPGGRVISTVHKGPYDTLHEAYAAMEEWMKGEGLTPAGPPWEVYVTDPTAVQDPSQWETRVYWPVA